MPVMRLITFTDAVAVSLLAAATIPARQVLTMYRRKQKWVTMRCYRPHHRRAGLMMFRYMPNAVRIRDCRLDALAIAGLFTKFDTATTNFDEPRAAASASA